MPSKIEPHCYCIALRVLTLHHGEQNPLYCTGQSGKSGEYLRHKLLHQGAKLFNLRMG